MAPRALVQVEHALDVASRISSNGRSTETPPRCTIASHPLHQRIDRRLVGQVAGHDFFAPRRAGAIAATSDRRITPAWGLRLSRSTLPRPPAAPVSSSLSSLVCLISCVISCRTTAKRLSSAHGEPVNGPGPGQSRGSSGGAPPASRNLAHELVEGIGAQIQPQVLKPGDKLPTESEIMRGLWRQPHGGARGAVQAAGLRAGRNAPRHRDVRAGAATGHGLSASTRPTSPRRSTSWPCWSFASAWRRSPRGWPPRGEPMRSWPSCARRWMPWRPMSSGAGDTVSPDFRFHLVDRQLHRQPLLRRHHEPPGRHRDPARPHQLFAAWRRKTCRPTCGGSTASTKRSTKPSRGATRDSARAAMRIHLTNSRERLRRAQEATQAAAP